MNSMPHQYEAIRTWGMMLGSYEYYITDEQRRAAAADAPLDALYERDGVWKCASQLGDEHRFHAMHADRLGMKA